MKFWWVCLNLLLVYELVYEGNYGMLWFNCNIKICNLIDFGIKIDDIYSVRRVIG